MFRFHWSLQFLLFVLLLSGTLFVMMSLKSGGLSPALNALLGIEQPQNELLETRVSWCGGNIKELRFANGHRIYEKGLHWYSENETVTEINPEAIETWIIAACSVRAEPVSAKVAQAGMKPELTVIYKNNSSETLFRASSEAFSWKGQVFRSPILEKAIQELIQLSRPKK